jgi:F0F1-type ATP synthase assembly protein I
MSDDLNNWRLAGLGTELAVCVGMFVALGYWLDQKFECSPWGLLGLGALGIVAGMYRFVKAALR